MTLRSLSRRLGPAVPKSKDEDALPPENVAAKRHERVPKSVVRSVRTVRIVIGIRTMGSYLRTTHEFFGRCIGRRVVVMDASDGGLRCFSRAGHGVLTAITSSRWKRDWP